jgi:hypothetical protein
VILADAEAGLIATPSGTQETSPLIATLASTKGLQFPGITHVVLYDEPRSKNVLHLIRSRVAAGLPLEVFVLRESQ